MRRSLARSALLVAATLGGPARAETAPTPSGPAAPPVAAPPVTPAPAAAVPPSTTTAPATPAATAAPIEPVPATLPESPPSTTPVVAPMPAAASPPQGVRFFLPAPADVPPPRPPEGPVRSHFNVGFNVDTSWYKSRSYDLFSTNDIAANEGISVGYALLLDGPLSVVPEIGFGVDDQTASHLFGGAIASTELHTTRLYGGVSVRYALLPFLEPEARLAFGASVLDTTIAPGFGSPGASPSLVDSQVSPFASIGGGFTLRTADAALETQSGSLRSVVLGITVEGGYVLAKPVDLAPSPDPAFGRIPTQDAALGTLERSSPYLRVSANVRF